MIIFEYKKILQKYNKKRHHQTESRVVKPFLGENTEGGQINSLAICAKVKVNTRSKNASILET